MNVFKFINDRVYKEKISSQIQFFKNHPNEIQDINLFLIYIMQSNNINGFFSQDFYVQLNNNLQKAYEQAGYDFSELYNALFNLR